MNAASAPVPNSKAAEQRAHEPSMEEILASIRKIIADDQVLPLTPRAARTPFVDEPQRTLEPAPSPREFQEEERRRPATSQPGQRADFHSGLASIFSNDRAPVLRPKIAPVVEEMELAGVPAGPQLVASAPEPAAASPRLHPRPESEIVRDMRASLVQNAERVHRVEPPAPPVPQPVARDEPRQQPRPQVFTAAPSVERVAHRAVEQSLSEQLLSAQADASIASAFRDLSASVALPDSDMIEAATRELLRPMLKEWLDDNLPVMVERLVRAEIERVARGPR